MMDDNIEDSSSSANNDSDEHISTSPVDGGEDQPRQVDSIVEGQKMRLESTLDVGDGTEHGGKRFKPSSDRFESFIVCNNHTNKFPAQHRPATVALETA